MSGEEAHDGLPPWPAGLEIQGGMRIAEWASLLRTRLRPLLGIWAAAVVGEALLYYFFLRQPYFRSFLAPFALVVVALALAGTWRVMRPRRSGDRRTRERRADERRAGR
jgi:hypothetical protein